MRLKKHGLGDFIDDAVEFNAGSFAPSSDENSFSADVPVDYSLPDNLEPPPESPDSSSFSADSIFSALSTFATKVAVPLYAASQQNEQQERALEYQYKIAQLKASSPKSLFPSTTRITGGTPRLYSQGGASNGIGILPWLALGAAGIGALILFIKK